MKPKLTDIQKRIVDALKKGGNIYYYPNSHGHSWRWELCDKNDQWIFYPKHVTITGLKTKGVIQENAPYSLLIS